jgi:hypothetical protein
MAVSVPQTVGVREYAEYKGNKEQVLSDSKVKFPSSFAVSTALTNTVKPSQIEKVPVDWAAN